MFIIQTNPSKTITWPVAVEVAVDGGKIKKYEFDGTFKLLNDDEKELITAEMRSDAPPDDVTSEAANAWKEAAVDNIMKIMTDWKGVVDETKTPIEFSRDNLRSAARSSQGISILRGINTAIGEINIGARAKN